MADATRRKSKTTPPDAPIPPTRTRRDQFNAEERAAGAVITEDTRRLSTDPRQVRNRLRRNGSKVEQDMAVLIEVGYAGFKPVSEWDYEELQRGKPRNADGVFKGRRPTWITPIIQAEIGRRLKSETLMNLNKHTASAVHVLVEFLSNSDEPHLRFKAAQLILEYVVGKPEQKVNIEGNLKLEAMLASALVLDDGSPAHPVIDGTIVDEDGGDDDDDD